jgi:predicted flap endonuclease-1-like 5' DNA nuclease/multidrug resistance efflux pump
MPGVVDEGLQTERATDRTMESPIIAHLPRGYRMDRQLGVIYEAAIGPSDDLTRIDGIRTREAVLLNQLGIYYFGQVALWRHREISAIAGELQVPVARIIDESWMEQARELCARPAVVQESDIPMGILRTVSLLACALLAGFLLVYLLGDRRNEPLSGVLSADITTLKVPADSRMTAVQVRAGQEVFSGQPLLTLEKIEHLRIIEDQERIVRDIEQELQKAEALASIDLEWRTRDLERELTSVAARLEDHQLSVRPGRQPDELRRTAERSAISPIASQRLLATDRIVVRPGGMLFFGASGQSGGLAAAGGSSSALVPTPGLTRTAELPRDGVMLDAALAAEPDPELSALTQERDRLIALRSALPKTIREALGIPAIKERQGAAVTQLETMKSVSREVHVTAPVYGVVGQVRFQPGDKMESGEVLVRILHTDRRYVIVNLPTRRVHEMKTGDQVELVFPGNQLFRGQVAEVPVLAETRSQTGETLAVVRITPVGRLWPADVPVGSQVDVISLQ